MKTKLLLLLLLANFSIYAQTNLVPNGDFETWTSSSQPDNWYRYLSGLIYQNSSAQKGNSSTKMEITSGTFNYMNSSPFAIQSGKTYRITLYQKLVSGTFSSIELSITKSDAFKTTIKKLADGTSLTSEWRKIEFDYVSTTSQNAEISVWITGTASSQVLIDNISVVDVAEIGPKYTLIPDVNFENALITFGYDSGVADGKVLTSKISALTDLNVSSKNISDLTGIEDFTSLKNLNCGANKLTSLNLSKNLALNELIAFSNQLPSIDVSNNINLTSLNVAENQISAIDVSQNTKLTFIGLTKNKLTSVNLSLNPNLTYISVSTNLLSTLDVSSNIYLKELYCGSNALTSLNTSKNLALEYLDFERNKVSAIDLSNNTLLKSLRCTSNTLVNLDLSKSSSLTQVLCTDNLIETLNVSNNPELKVLWCAGNKLTSLETSKIPKLSTLVTGSNDIATLDLSSNTNLSELTCDRTKIETLDVTRNVQLTLLDAGFNSKITSLNLTKNVNLKVLRTESMSGLVSLDLSENKALENLSVNSVSISNLDLSKNPNLTRVTCINNLKLKGINLQNGGNAKLTSANLLLVSNSILTCIQVDDVAYSNTNWSSSKDSKVVFTDQACIVLAYTLIPDSNFEQKLIDLGIDKDGINGKVLTSNILTVKDLNLQSTSITDLTGIEDFAALENLTTPGTNKITKLNVTKNTALKTLVCQSENLTTLDINNNTKLVTLNAGNNKLTALNTSKNLALESLNINNNQVNSLDVQNNTNLTSLIVNVNPSLATLNVSKNTKLLNLETSNTGLSILNLSANTLLTNLDCSNNKLTSLDVSANTKLTNIACNNNKLTNLDISKNVLLVSLTSQNNELKSLNLKNGKNTLFGTNLNFKNNSNLTCILVDDASYANSKWNTYKDISANYNVDCTVYTLIPDSNFEDKLINLQIDKDGKNGKVATSSISSVTSLDVSSSLIKDLTGIQDFSSLKVLNCSKNQLTSLIPANNPLLTELNCSENTLAVLDLSQNLTLTQLDCSKNQLTVIDVNKNLTLTKLNCSFNAITSIDVSKNKALTSLDVSNNNLNSLNVKNGFNTNLDWFNVNFTKNAALTCIQVDNAKYSNDNWNGKLDKTSFFTENCGSYTLIPDSNFEDKLIELKIDVDGKNGKVLTSTIATVTDLNVQLSDIKDLTGIQDFAALEFLNCQFNLLTSLNVTKNSKLIELYTHGNDLTTLNVSANTALTTLQVNKNKLTTLDISKNSKLVYVNVSENALKTLNLKNGNNTNFITAFMFKNPALSCIQVDNAAFATASSVFSKDITASYSATCTLGIEDSVFDKVSVYPNPTKGDVYINNISLEKATVYNSLGQLVKSFVFKSGDTNNTINLSGLPKGIYYVYLINEDAASAKKVIVE
jgi:Leucine-rich repeat (LRR) protein